MSASQRNSGQGGQQTHWNWPTGFTLQRLKLTLQYANRDSFYETILLLAENATKVTYNAYGYPAPFDHDVGWWVVANLAHVAAKVNEAAFAAKAWSLMSNKEYVKLKAPIMCHPACPVCYTWYLDNLVEKSE
jgi:hypothetical protein